MSPDRPVPSIRKSTLATWIALLVLVAAVSTAMVVSFMPVSEKTIRTDLNTALDAAQSAVESYYAVNSTIPDRVPSAALSQIILLERTDSGCRLRLTMNGIAMSRDVLLPASQNTQD